MDVRMASGEEAREIPGFGGRYAATRDGKILDMEKGGAPLPAKPGRPSEGDRVTLGGRGGSSRLVADLVAGAYIDNPHGLVHASRKDGDPRNDRLENLSWGPEPLRKEDGEVERWAEAGWTPHIVTDMGRVIGKEWGTVLECHLGSGGARNFRSAGGKGAGKLVGDMVAEAFGVPNPFGLRHALHKNGDPADDRLENLTFLPSELEASVAAGEQWAYHETGTGDRLLVSSKGRLLSAATGRFLTGDCDGATVILAHRYCRRKADLVAETFGVPNPFGLRHALARDGDAANCRLDNVTYDPGEVTGKEGEWRPVPGYEGRYLLGTCGTFLKIETDINPFEEGFCPNDSPFRSYKALVPESGPRVAKRIADWMALTFPDLLGENQLGAAHPWNLDGDPSSNAVGNLSWTPGPSPLWPELPEEWVVLPEGGGSHIVSSLGRIANLSTGAVLRPQALDGGRLRAHVTQGGVTTKIDVATTVASLFIGPGAEGERIVHLNCDPLDNRAANIRWTTEKDLRGLVLEAARHGAAPGEIAAYHKIGVNEVCAMLGIARAAGRTAFAVEGWKTEERLAREAVRNRRARDTCLRIKGHTCTVCGVDMSEFYGIGINPDVHHLDPLCEIHGSRPVDPVTDLVPVCPNCHRALHSKPGGAAECYTPEELREMLGKRGRKRPRRIAA